MSAFLAGIDLGTSNCAVAFVDRGSGAEGPIVDFHIAQLQRPGEVVQGALLPSSLYLPDSHELPPEALRLPWGDSPDIVVGEFARWQGARVPGRLVSSAKSWLCHPDVDRAAPILPWGAPTEARRISPVAASAQLLAHIRKAWDFAHPDEPLAAQEVIITVPASFDEVARALTVSAAKQAGLEKFTLVEEPQAAFYDFIARHRRDLERALQGIRLVLVVDVGGGTSDFTLVQTAATPEGPLLRRIAVGEHLMLGGDNMDAALGRVAEEKMLGGGRKLSIAQWTQLAQGARLAKESLLKSGAPEQYNLAVVAEGSRLVGGALSATITRVEAEKIILEGFLPACAPEELPHRGTRAALQEVGLPYAQDPAITRHLAAFLRAHAAAGFAALALPGGPDEISAGRSASNQPVPSNGPLPRPDAILLNGGVFNSPAITRRLVEAVSAWWPEAGPIPLLHHDSLELAVARGAAYYGLVRHGMGQRIGGGAAHALYVGLEKPGTQAPQALCVIPRGQEEGIPVEIGERVFHLALGRPVRFPLFSSAADRLERSGDIVPASEDMRPLAPIHALLKGAAGKSGNEPVHLSATLTEIGTLELWCVSDASQERWRLEFELRGGVTDGAAATVESMPPAFAEARQWVERIFGHKLAASQPAAGQRASAPGKGSPRVTPPKDAKQLWRSLEESLGPRETWRSAVLRELWSALLAGASKRRRSAEHERVFFQLLGYTLRPGFGYPLDEWRCEQTAELLHESVQFHNEKAVWNEFWVLWRRISGGLSEARQDEIWKLLEPHLALRVPPHPAKLLPRPKGTQPEGLEEMVRLAAALEHLAPTVKVVLGEWIVARLRHSGSGAGPWLWALGRLGARAPIYGSIHKVIPPQKAAQWSELLLRPELLSLEGALFALAQLGRLTGDRARDLEPEIRERLLQALKRADASPSWQRMVMEVVALGAADRARALGDTLPVGLSIV